MILDVHDFHYHFKAIDAPFSMEWKPGLIQRIFKSPVNSAKARIISLTILFFVAIGRMELQSYT